MASERNSALQVFDKILKELVAIV
ncbi:hypothetical protein Godav_029278, partial [Gossypium davidsonii]|nr:hypothetical protein [Gossypium davidsonii]